MRIYFSGGRGLTATPEALIPKLKPHIMLTFHDIGQRGTRDRLKVYLTRNQNENPTRRIPKRPQHGQGGIKSA